MNPRHPLYIVSKGRATSRLTVKTLELMHVPYRIVIERAEYDAYAAVIDPANILLLDPAYQDAYDTRDLLGRSKSVGSGPARNFVWDHAQAAGATWHWTVDDNIRSFDRLYRNTKHQLLDGTGFRLMEDFCDRYRNIAMAGPNYRGFVPQGTARPPFIRNTRIYSCNLIRTAVPFRWRCRYNEDTDLSLRMLKAGWCTVQFNAVLQDKLVTQALPGGNTDAWYAREGTLPKSRMLVREHPDVARLVWRFGRWHHYVDYRGFTQGLQRRPDVPVPHGPDPYGLTLVPRAHLSAASDSAV